VIASLTNVEAEVRKAGPGGISSQCLRERLDGGVHVVAANLRCLEALGLVYSGKGGWIHEVYRADRKKKQVGFTRRPITTVHAPRRQRASEL
jgi:hypothetical protein